MDATLAAKVRRKIEVTDTCHLWRGTLDKNAAPFISVKRNNGKTKQHAVRSLLWWAAHPDDRRKRVYLPVCGNLLCVRLGDGHVEAFTQSEAGQHAVTKRGRSQALAKLDTQVARVRAQEEVAITQRDAKDERVRLRTRTKYEQLTARVAKASGVPPELTERSWYYRRAMSDRPMRTSPPKRKPVRPPTPEEMEGVEP